MDNENGNRGSGPKAQSDNSAYGGMAEYLTDYRSAQRRAKPSF